METAIAEAVQIPRESLRHSLTLFELLYQVLFIRCYYADNLLYFCPRSTTVPSSVLPHDPLQRFRGLEMNKSKS